MGLENPLSLLTSDLAIDLGAANTVLAVQGQGVVLDEPSVVAIRHRGSAREVLAVGAGARQMLGRTPESIRAVRPVQEGAITDYEVAEAMLSYFIARAVGKRQLVKPRVLVCVPIGVSEIQRRAVQDCTRAAGAREVLLVHSPVAAALGAGLPVSEPLGTLVCDLGAGTTEMAVLSLGGVVASRTLLVGGDRFDRAIAEHLRQAHGVEIGERTAEAIKIELGCGAVHGEHRSLEVKGRHLDSGIPKPLTLTSADAKAALQGPLDEIIEALRALFEATPPELAADILDAGMVLTGGSSQLLGLDELLREATDLPVVVAPQPLRSVVLGAEAALRNPKLLRQIAI